LILKIKQQNYYQRHARFTEAAARGQTGQNITLKNNKAVDVKSQRHKLFKICIKPIQVYTILNEFCTTFLAKMKNTKPFQHCYNTHETLFLQNRRKLVKLSDKNVTN